MPVPHEVNVCSSVKAGSIMSKLIHTQLAAQLTPERRLYSEHALKFCIHFPCLNVL